MGRGVRSEFNTRDSFELFRLFDLNTFSQTSASETGIRYRDHRRGPSGANQSIGAAGRRLWVQDGEGGLLQLLDCTVHGNNLYESLTRIAITAIIIIIIIIDIVTQNAHRILEALARSKACLLLGGP